MENNVEKIEITQSETLGKFALALSKAQGVMQPAKKTSTNSFLKSSYADFSAVVEACKKPLSDNEIAFTQIPCFSANGKSAVATQLIHSSGEWIKGIMELPVIKPGAQEIGSAITYVKRYTLSSMAGVTLTDEDDDGEAAMNGITRDKKDEPKINENQIAEILEYTGEDTNRINKILQFYNAKTLQDIPVSKYDKIIAHLAKPKAAQRRVSA